MFFSVIVTINKIVLDILNLKHNDFKYRNLFILPGSQDIRYIRPGKLFHEMIYSHHLVKEVTISE